MLAIEYDAPRSTLTDRKEDCLPGRMYSEMQAEAAIQPAQPLAAFYRRRHGRAVRQRQPADAANGVERAGDAGDGVGLGMEYGCLDGRWWRDGICIYPGGVAWIAIPVSHCHF